MARALRMFARGGRPIVYPGNSASTTRLTKETHKHHGSTIQWRGRSGAASAASDVPNPQKGHKKVSIDERRVMLKSYINKYREDNAGKFPTASKVKGEVGGSYYTVKKVIQELEYHSKLDSSSTEVKTPTANEPRKNRKSRAIVEDIPDQVGVDPRSEDVAEPISRRGAMSSANLRDETITAHDFAKPSTEGINPDPVQTQNAFLRKDDEGTLYPLKKREDAAKEAHDDRPKFVSEQNHLKEKIKEDEEDESTRNSSMDVDRARAGVPKGRSDSDSPWRQERQHQASIESDTNKEPPQKSTFWGSLKSFADGIISIWRKR